MHIITSFMLFKMTYFKIARAFYNSNHNVLPKDQMHYQHKKCNNSLVPPLKVVSIDGLHGNAEMPFESAAVI